MYRSIQDIERDRDLAQQEYDAQDAVRKAEFDEYSRVEGDLLDAVKNTVENIVERYRTFLDIQVETTTRYGYAKVEIDVNRNRREDADMALSWYYSAWIDRDGELCRGTGTWSGLDAVTRGQIIDLQTSVQLLSELVNVDWKEVLQKLPNPYDYIKSPLPDSSKLNNLNRELTEAQLAQYVGKPVLLSDKSDRGYYMIISEGAKTYTVRYAGGLAADRLEGGRPETVRWFLAGGNGNSRVAKDELLSYLKMPLQTIPLEARSKDAEEVDQNV